MTTDAQGFYPELHTAPTLVEGKRPHWNDFQPAVYNKITKQWNAWVLENQDINTETGTEWRKLVSDDLIKWTPAEITIPKNTAGFGDAWTGQCFIDDTNVFGFGAGSWCFFLTMACPDAKGNQNQSVVLWTAPDGQTQPVCQGIVLANPYGNNAHFRDPSVRLVNGYPEMTITYEKGISIYQFNKGEWIKLQDIIAPYNTVECAQRFTIWSEDFGKNMEIVVFSGNIFNVNANENTTVSMFSVLTPCASGYCMTSMSYDVRRMVINGGTDFYSFRLFSGLPDECCPNNTKIYGMAWLGNWDYDAGLPIEEWCGQLSMTCEVTLRASPTGYPMLCAVPLKMAWKRKYTSSFVNWSGDYSNIPFRQVPDVCEINLTIKKGTSGTFPLKWSATLYGGGYSGAKFYIDQTQDVPVATITRDDYGLRPYGDLSSWNYFPALPIPSDMEEYRLRVIKDNSSLTWILNEQWVFTQLILYPMGSQSFYVDIPKGYMASGDCTIQFNKFPEKTLSTPTDLDISGRCMPIETPVITTYSGPLGTVTNHAIKQLAWVTDTDPGNPTTGLVGVLDDFGTGARSMELKATNLEEDYNAFKAVAITSPKSTATSKQVLQLFCDQNTNQFTATVGAYGTPAISMEPELEEYRKIGVTSFQDENGDTTGNRMIRQITYNTKGGGYQAIISPLSDEYKETINAGGTLPNDPGNPDLNKSSGSSGNSGNSGSSGSSGSNNS